MEKFKDLWKYTTICNDSITLNGTFLNNDNHSASYPTSAGNVLYKMVRDNDFGYIVEESDRFVICFAGSNDIKDWVNNFEFFTLKENNTISDGFYTSWLKFKDTVSEIVSEYAVKCKNLSKNINIIGIGHSRGAALVTLAIRHIAKNLGIPCRCICFGSPKLGNKKYAQEFELLPIDMTRIVNGWDIVTSVPFKELGFFDVGKQVNIKQPFWHMLMVFKVSDHLTYGKECEKRNI